VRQALQQSLSQLVLADRRIEDDKVVRDSILSTMNGFVESFHVLSQSEGNGRVQIKAEVQISTSAIHNFVFTNGKGSARFDGNTLLGDISRDDLARSSRSSILKRLFDGFPTLAFDVKVVSVSMDPENRGFVLVTLELQANKQFIKTLKGGLNVIGRSQPPDYITPDVVSVCFKAGLSENPSTNCGTVSVDLPSLNQQRWSDACPLAFLIWFSGSNSSPLLIEAQYLRPNPTWAGAGFSEVGGAGKLFTSQMPNDRGEGGIVELSETVHRFTVRIARESIPEGSKEIHALPLFVELGPNTVLLDLFETEAPLHGTKFNAFAQDILQNQP
jgi:hypothetical protein